MPYGSDRVGVSVDFGCLLCWNDCALIPWQVWRTWRGDRVVRETLSTDVSLRSRWEFEWEYLFTLGFNDNNDT